MKRKHFRKIDRIKKACTTVLEDIPEEAYRNAFENWKTRWKRFIYTKEAYFKDFLSLINKINNF